MANKSLPQKKRRKRRLPPGVVEKDGRWYVRVRYREGGRRHAAWRECAKNPKHAKQIREELKAELAQHGPISLRAAGKTYGDLAKYYEDNYLVEAKYVDGKKVAGRRNTKNPQLRLRQLRAMIGESTRLRDMDYEFMRRLRLRMINTPVVVEKWVANEKKKRGHKERFERQRSITDVNRKMAELRHQFTVARRALGWIHHDPFADALEPLVTPADEKKRERVMSPDEEARLLACCTEETDYLRLMILGLAYTLMRSESEFFKLVVRDLDFQARRINVQQLNTKTLSARGAPMPKIFADEARHYIDKHQLAPDDRLFPFRNVKRSWSTLKRRAGVSDLRIKDLRRTAATRLHRAGMPLGELMLLLGHTTIEMTRVYIGVDEDTTGRANELFDSMYNYDEEEVSAAVN